MSTGELLHRLSLLLMAGSAVFFAALLHPRKDHLNKLAVSVVALVLMTLGLGNSSLLILNAMSDQRQIDRWAKVHDEIRYFNEIDIEHIEGNVWIFPGESLDLQLDVTVRLTESYTGGELLFNFNPDLKIQTLTLAEDENAAYRFENGLIVIVPSVDLASDSSITFHLEATGLPNPSFSYLDSSKDVGKAIGMDGSLAAFGIYSSLFQSNYVALMSEVRWLPQAGPYSSTWADPDRLVDFFTLDLEIEIPENWLVAGPGKRKPLSKENERETFKISPKVSLPQVSLLAAEFKRYSLQKRGIEFELLIDEYHTRSVEYFVDGLEDIHDEIDRIFDVLDAAGITYPFQALSFVEVPIQLRTIGGGWRMDTVQAQPAIVMLREHTFLKSNFQFIQAFQNVWTRTMFELLAQREFNNLPFKVRQIREHFTSDLSGGNVLDGITRNLFLLRTNPTGPAAPAIAQLNHAMLSKILFGEVGYFSPFAHSYAKDYDFLLLPPLLSRTYEEFSKSGLNPLFVRSELIRPVLNREATHPSILSKISEFSLSDLSYDEDIETTFDFIDKKAYSTATSLLDNLGQESVAIHLRNLLNEFDGENFQLASILKTIDESQIDFPINMRDWTTTSDLPGFLVSTPRVARISDSELDLPRYQTSFHVRNDELTPGLFSVYLVTRGNVEVAVAGYRLGGHESVKFNLLSNEKAMLAYVRPYLALNHDPLLLNLQDIREESMDDLDALPLIEESDWQPERSRYIIVDDLDRGFSAIDLPKSELKLFSWLLERNTPKLKLDYGLPTDATTFRVFAPELNQWVRSTDLSSWGKYRKTTAIYYHNEPNLKAKFEVMLPEIGEWQLDYHVAKRYTRRGGSTPNIYPLQISSGSARYTVELSIEDSLNTWLNVGSFDLPSQQVAVTIRTENNANGKFYYTVADAIRWSKVPESGN